MTTLREAIAEGFKKAGWNQPAEDVFYQIEFSVNAMEGRAANEAMKRVRRLAAVEQITRDLPKHVMTSTVELAEWLEEIIEQAQG